ncbi:MAG: hypothetical protein PHN49_10505 [Candidatus Omnitrophica bacterium]|nr:hypothetical protein [Candidatus Omnitrophota bacterium]
MGNDTFKNILKFFVKRRYLKRCVLLGALAFCLFEFTNGMPYSFPLIGPPLYIASLIKQFLLPSINLTSEMRDYGLLLPVTMLYFIMIGLQLGQLTQEHGIRKPVTILSFLAFLIYIHYKTWVSLSGYYLANQYYPS